MHNKLLYLTGHTAYKDVIWDRTHRRGCARAGVSVLFRLA